MVPTTVCTLWQRGLNDVHKKGERERIDRENQALLRRLQDVRPSIDAEAVRQQYALHEHLIAQHSAQFVPNPFLNNTAPGSAMHGGFFPTPPASASGLRPSGTASRAGSAPARRPQSGGAVPGAGYGMGSLLAPEVGGTAPPSDDPDEAMREVSKLLEQANTGRPDLPKVDEAPEE